MTPTAPDYTPQVLTATKEADSLHLELCRPDKGNALNDALIIELERALQACRRDGTRQIVFSGRGRHFCTGFDLSSMQDETDATLLLRFVKIEQFLQEVYFSPFATIAIARGRCYGAGADLFTACDHRIAFDDASFAFPGAAFGLVLGTARLASVIGRDAARRIILPGKVLNAQEALGVGLVTAIATDDDHLEQMMARHSAGASRLEDMTVAALHRATNPASGDADLAALVRSAARPGLVERIRAYQRQVKATQKS